MSKTMKAVRRRGVTGLAWASLVIAFGGGALAVGTGLGDAVVTVLHALPWVWLPPVLLFVAVVGCALDMFLDGVPNQFAVGAALLMPSMAAGSTGRLGDKVLQAADAVTAWIDSSLAPWIGTSSSTGLAVASVVAAILMARRVVKKSRGKGAAVAEAV